MDRLRSLEYFIVSAEEGSFSAAARRLDVTIPAVSKMVGALERDLGVPLFERSARGLALTTAGEAYLETCRPAVATLRQLDEQTRGTATTARGTVVVGVQHVAAQELLVPCLPRFHARYPEIQVDLRESTQIKDPDAPGIDVQVSFAWPKREDMVHRSLAKSRFRVCAAPSYWAQRGVPKHPRDLAKHECVLIRTQTGMVMDVWAFERGGVREEVTVEGWLVCNNAHRDVAMRMAIAGQGVVRVLEWTDMAEIASGTLVPVLEEWTCPDAPPIVISYLPGARRVARVRLFIEFLQEVLLELDDPAVGRRVARPPPRWAGVTVGRASSLLGKGRGKR